MGLRGRSQFSDENTFFITTTVVEFMPVFSVDRYCQILIDNIKYYQGCRHHFKVLGYVIMCTHFHWIINVDPALDSISNIMRDIKKFTAWDVFSGVECNGDANLLRVFHRNAPKGTDQKRRLWMKRFDDEVIRNHQMFSAKLQYIHDNPVKAGLVMRAEDCRYSSARNYAFADHTILQVDTSFL